MEKRAMSWLGMFLVVGFASLVFPAAAEASWLGAGCWICDAVGLTGVEERCDTVGNDQHGDGTNCNESYVWGWYCYTNNTPCYNTVVNGGGGALAEAAVGRASSATGPCVPRSA